MLQSAFLCKCTVGAALVSAALMMAALVGLGVHLFPGKEEDRTGCTSTPVPSLVASAGHGEATLKWNLPEGHWPHIEHWQYKQADKPNEAGPLHNTGTTATTHVVPGLTNGVTYYFRIRAVLEHGAHGCWSNGASATPSQPGNVLDVLKEMATHQKQMAVNTHAIAGSVTVNREVLKDLGERGVVAIGSLGDKVANGLAGIERRLMERPAALPPDLCEGKIIGKIYFDHDSHEMTDDGDAMSKMAAVLKKLPAGAVVLTVGYANAVGAARHNLHLSDLRAACATYCLRQRLGNRGDGFQFRELAMGEEIDASDPTGTSSESRRVDVKVCRGPVSPEWRVLAEWEGAAETCHCP